MLKPRREIELSLAEVIKSTRLKSKKKIVEDVKLHLSKYGIVDTQGWINDPESELSSLDIRELVLFTEQVFAKTGDLRVNPEDFFTSGETKEARQFSGASEIIGDVIELPYTIPNVLQLSSEEYVCILDASEINKLMKSNILYYNLDIQREAKVVKRKDQVVLEATLNMKNVKEITQNLLEGKQFPSELKLNAAVRTSDSGDELIYDAKHLELTITKGTRLDILDGFHRIKGIENAFAINPNIRQKFTISITNYSTRMAQLAQSQIAKASPFSKVRIQELEQSRHSDIVVKQLKDESDLRGRISQTNRIHSVGNELVTYNVLADTIDEEFKMDTRADAADVGDYLVEFFNMLLGSHPDEFLHNVEETRKVCLMVDNNFFIGYLVLARKMMEAGIKPRNVRKYINEIDFNRFNPLWREKGITDEKGHITETNKARKAIKRYFEEIKV